VQSIGELSEKVTKLEQENKELRAIGKGQQTTGIESLATNSPALSQNSPNPFIYSTRIKMNVPANASKATLNIYDLNGRLLKQIDVPGRNETEVQLSNNSFAEGLYIYSLIIDGQLIDSKKWW